jgi:myo-inositol 2-dehydrogenase/D-chiro-inositol 1-dehydrogenase
MHDSNFSSRRNFLKTSSSAVLGGALVSQIVFPAVVRGAPDTRKLKIGFIGCGGRGSGAANQALSADENLELYAMGDAFAEKIGPSLAALQKNHPNKINVPAERQFAGLDAYQKVIDSGVDLVILTTPPGFRPVHFKAAIDANKHVFLEKPMATDAPGLRSVMATAEEAKRKNLAVVAGFCWRYDLARREFFKRIHEGAIGELRAVYHTYYTSPVKPMPAEDRRPAGMGDLEWQMRNWYNFVWLCGDSLVEQAVHSVDKLAWAMKDVPPLKAVAVGGRQIPNHGGNIFDHFEVNYEYANGVRGFLGCRQQANCYGETRDYLIGTKGVGNIGGRRAAVEINGDSHWQYSGPTPDMYQVEHDELFASIRHGEPINDGKRMCTSTLLALMGRMAAYTGKEISWEQALNSKESLVPEKLDWEMKLTAAPMPMPGRTRFM